jgi:hypothetical protein
MATLKHLYALLSFVLFVTYSGAQVNECVLDIGGKNSEFVTEIFQLNEAQLLQMEELRAEYSMTYKAIDDQMQKLLSEHPQSTSEELLTMADKYKVLQNKIVMASRQIDEKLLTSFNQRQYGLYLSLCHEAFRTPIEVTPLIYDGPTGENK